MPISLSRQYVTPVLGRPLLCRPDSFWNVLKPVIVTILKFNSIRYSFLQKLLDRKILRNLIMKNPFARQSVLHKRSEHRFISAYGMSTRLVSSILFGEQQPTVLKTLLI